ncbi:selenide, water dikinase SelD [Sulfitobacter sp. HNIBRBA2951]|uniref:selenide, water dikinase SelD n=1 Tax=Sulfitobacter aquimarinus TaxID=3158557 RepID=UPI0032DF45EC
MQYTEPLTRDLLLVGGGHAHALVLKMWGMRGLAGARVTVVDRGPTTPYTGMLPGFIAGHYTRDEIEIDLHRLCRFAGARLIVGSVTSIDPNARRVALNGGRVLDYDVMSVNVGIHSAMPDLPGFSEFAVPAKPLGAFASAWQTYLDQVEAGVSQPQATVIGGGIAGIELALAMTHALRARTPHPKVTLIEASSQIAAHAPASRRGLGEVLEGSGVQVITGTTATRINRDTIELNDGRRIPSTFTVGAAGAHAHRWLQGADLPLTDDGFIRVGPELRITEHNDIFAVGDCAHLTHAPRAKAGVFSVRAAPVLYRNLRAALSGRPMRKFQPQKSYLKLVSLGGKAALAEKWGIAFASPLLWRLKDRIDRKFIAQLSDLPDMPLPKPPRVMALDDGALRQPLCSGCGGKIAPTALNGALSQLEPVSRTDVVLGPGDDAAIIANGGANLVLTSDHLRAFTEDPATFTRIAALHALGDIWAMGAQPQSVLVNLTLPRMSVPLQQRTMAEIMKAAEDVFTAAGAAIVGGHSSLGLEMSVGFSLTGVLDGAPISTAGARVGDALVLTRAIGTGTIFAADMKGLVSGSDMHALLTLLAQPQDSAARILRQANAMTDVTGFGLAGHLSAICKASKVGAVLDLGALPLHANARRLAEAGIRSTIWEENRRAAPVQGGDGPRKALLHDPQTAGGLLASIDPSQAPKVVHDLRKAGHDAAIIGHVVDTRHAKDMKRKRTDPTAIEHADECLITVCC